MQTFVQDRFFHQSLIKVYHYQPFVCFVGKVFFFFFRPGVYTIEILYAHGGIYPWGCQLWKMGHWKRDAGLPPKLFFFANKQAPQKSMFKGESVWVSDRRMTVTPKGNTSFEYLMINNVIVSNTWFGEIWPIPPGKILIPHALGWAPRTPIPTYFSKRSPLGSSKRWGIQPPLFLVQDWFATKIMAVQI